MRDLIARVDAGLFWGLVAGWVLGMVTSWRFASLLASIRDAVSHARHHLQRAKDFFTYARDHFAQMVGAGVLVLAATGFVGWLVFLRVTGAG